MRRLANEYTLLQDEKHTERSNSAHANDMDVCTRDKISCKYVQSANKPYPRQSKLHWVDVYG